MSETESKSAESSPSKPTVDDEVTINYPSDEAEDVLEARRRAWRKKKAAGSRHPSAMLPSPSNRRRKGRRDSRPSSPTSRPVKPVEKKKDAVTPASNKIIYRATTDLKDSKKLMQNLMKQRSRLASARMPPLRLRKKLKALDDRIAKLMSDMKKLEDVLRRQRSPQVSMPSKAKRKKGIVLSAQMDAEDFDFDDV